MTQMTRRNERNPMKITDELALKMMAAMAGDPKRIQHFTKVHSYAALMGREEGLDADTQAILEMAALVHDIGIVAGEAKFGRCDGKIQEQEGPALARNLLQSLGVEDAAVDRVAYLVGHHHTYHHIDGLDYQILVEADFLVNLYEDNASDGAIESAYKKIFRTESGRKICRMMYGLVEK